MQAESRLKMECDAQGAFDYERIEPVGFTTHDILKLLISEVEGD